MSVAIFLAVVCPVFALPVGIYGMHKDIRHWKIYAFLFALFFAAIAYNYYPLTNSDLTRYFELLDQMRVKNLLQLIVEDKTYMYVTDVWFWLVSKSGNYHLLPAISTFGVYYIGAYISGWVAYHYKCEKYIVWQLLLLTCALDLTIIVNYVRNIFAFALIIMAAFRWWVENKKNLLSILLIILPIFIHSTAIIMVFLLLFVPLVKKMKWRLIIVALLSTSIVNFCYVQFYGMGGNWLTNMLNGVILKAYRYFNGDVATTWALQLSNSILSQGVKWYQLFLAACSMIVFLQNQRSNQSKFLDHKNISVFSNYIFLAGTLALSCIPVMTPAYNRFYSAFMLGVAVLLLPAARDNIRLVRLVYPLSIFGIVKWMYSMSYEVDYLRLFKIFITNPLYLVVQIFLDNA